MYYVGYYTTDDDVRVSSPAANAKIISISEALRNNGIQVEIISTCNTAAGAGFIPGRKLFVEKGVSCRQIPFISTNMGFLRHIQYWLTNLWLSLFLMMKVKKGETVLLYHSIERSLPVLFAKNVRKFRLLLEVEEIYADALKLTKTQTKIEQKIFRAADAFIFPTELLNERVNTENKKYAIIYGTYKAEKNLAAHFDDGRIHVVYAGTLDSHKGGAYAAIRCARFLPDHYCVHILGFGNASEIKAIKDLIEEETRECDGKIVYEGCMKGEKYNQFLQSCHIGLSTQNPTEKFNDSSFPSKILSYLANGLKVVSARIPVVAASEIAPYIEYYDEHKPECIAAAIQNIDMSQTYEGRACITKLQNKFEKSIAELMLY